MKTHIIESGVVVNTILATVAEAQAAFPNAICTIGDTGGIGWTWDGTTLTPPPAPPPAIPQVVSRAQFILALLQLDLLDEVEAAIAQADRATQINYKERLEFERNYPLVTTMAQALGKTEAEIDGLFMLAATL